MPFLLMVFLTLVCLPEVEEWPTPLWTASPAWSLTATWLAVGLTVLYARLVAGRLRRLPEADAALRERLLRRYERGRVHHQLAVFVVYVLSLLVLGWGWTVSQLWTWDGQAHLPGVELILLAPFVAGQVLGWAMFYDAEQAAHQPPHRLLSLEPIEDRGSRIEDRGSNQRDPCGTGIPARATPAGQECPAHTPSSILDPRSSMPAAAWLELEQPRVKATPFGSRWSYVVFQTRQKLALVFLPVALLLIQKELTRLFPQALQDWQGAVNVLGLLSVLAVFVCMPWIVRLLLGLKPLPAGPLRDRLLAASRRLRFRCGDILLWNTRSGMANAMVIGIVPWVRYVVFTDRLVEDFTPEEVEAVLGHEVGHIRHRHMLYYFGFLLASVAMLGCLATLFERYYEKYYGPGLNLGDHKYLAYPPVVGLLLGYIFVVFGFLSRRCERQADVFGCRAVSCTRPDCTEHDGDLVLPDSGRGLCPTGIRTFIRALEKVALVNGISRDRPGFLQSWQHSTIARRVEFLQRVLLDPRVETRFQRRVGLFKWVLFVVLCGALAFLAVNVQMGTGAPRASSRPPAAEQDVSTP